MAVFFFLICLLALAGAFWARRTRRHRRALLASTLSQADRAILAREVPLVHRLPPALRDRLDGKINLFLSQVTFIGCNGLKVTDDMRLSIAAQACLLVVNSDYWYDGLHDVLIYPGAFKSRQTRRSGYVVTERDTIRTGESWSRGPVILSWQHTRQGAQQDRDGHNVVFHEFAHQLDALSGRVNGVPALDSGQSYAEWGAVFSAAYAHHVAQVETGHPTVLDPYGATGPEEFFAVAIEAFLERPADLIRHAAPVYAQLSKVLHLDPLRWTQPAR